MMEQDKNIDTLKLKIIGLLDSTKREGMNNLISEMYKLGYFRSPASTRYHNSFPGGLALHSLNVYREFVRLNKTLQLNISDDSIIIAALLHDLCKAGAYIPNGEKFRYNSNHPKGHAALSIDIIERHIKLKEVEKEMIKYHMGIYGTNEFVATQTWGNGEYMLSDMSGCYNQIKACKFFHIADELAAQKESVMH